MAYASATESGGPLRQSGRNKTCDVEVPMQKLAASSGLAKFCAQLSLLERRWDAFVGSGLASRSRPEAFDGGVLTVVVENAAALYDMNFKKASIQREIGVRTALNIREIRIEVGRTRRMSGVVPRGRLRRNAKRRLRQVEPAAEREMVERILSVHKDMDPLLAKIIVRCRILCEDPETNDRKVD